MADDEAIALYGMVKKMAQAMTAREAALDVKTAALAAAVAELRQLPGTARPADRPVHRSRNSCVYQRRLQGAYRGCA